MLVCGGRAARISRGCVELAALHDWRAWELAVETREVLLVADLVCGLWLAGGEVAADAVLVSFGLDHSPKLLRIVVSLEDLLAVTGSRVRQSAPHAARHGRRDVLAQHLRRQRTRVTPSRLKRAHERSYGVLAFVLHVPLRGNENGDQGESDGRAARLAGKGGDANAVV